MVGPEAAAEWLGRVWHHGGLFLGKFPEFPGDVLDMLRQPIEDGPVTIAGSAMTICFPAPLMLVER